MPYSRRQYKSSEFELTPLIDIIFILLIFFAVSTSIINHKTGLNLQLPTAETSNENKKGIIVSVDLNQKLYFDTTQIPLKELSPRLKTQLLKDPSLQIILNIDKQTPYHYLIEIMDTIRLSGCYDIILETKKKS